MSVIGAIRRIMKGSVQQSSTTEAPGNPGFLTRLRRNESGNTLAIMAIAIFPLAGLVGGGFDMSRLYLVKTRLQQACDAGALAGRRVMGAGQWNANNNAANRAALQFFDGNFEANSYGSSNLARTFSEAGGRVTGTASATVPMTLMRIFGEDSRTLSVACDAEMRLPNTDIMFVLDTTGSMAQTIPGDSSTKIDTLKFAVKCFYETVAKLDTDANCTPGTPGPTGGTDGATQTRFGFMPYSTNVNVGALLPSSYIANDWTYQSRVANYTTPTPVANGSTANGPYWEYYRNNGTTGFTSTASQSTSISQAHCLNFMRNQAFSQGGGTPYSFAATPTSSGTAPSPTVATTFPHDGAATDGGANGEWGWTGAPDTSSGGSPANRKSCRRRRTDTTTTYVTRYGFTNWTYRPESLDVSQYKNGAATFATGTSGTVPTSGTYDMRELATLSGAQGITTSSLSWGGCIEERATVRQTSYSPIPSGALDLNIDLEPSSGTAGSYWGPALPEAVFLRGRYYDAADNQIEGTRSYANVTSSTDYINGYWGGFFCGTQARKLQTWATASTFQTYVNSLTPTGNTYHDIGMIWGARFMSPTGIFASENAYTPAGGEIERHMIFMTDGETCTGHDNYQAYGVAWWDRRQTSTSSAPTDGCDDSDSDGGTLSQQVNARFSAICTAVKNKNITLWVVYFGSTDTDTVNRMTTCASPNRFYYATNSSALITSFRQIAEQITQLRLTR
jgi:Flp pilus assembly protein TadG